MRDVFVPNILIFFMSLDIKHSPELDDIKAVPYNFKLIKIEMSGLEQKASVKAFQIKKVNSILVTHLLDRTDSTCDSFTSLVITTLPMVVGRT